LNRLTLLYQVSSVQKQLIWFYIVLLFLIPWWWYLAGRNIRNIVWYHSRSISEICLAFCCRELIINNTRNEQYKRQFFLERNLLVQKFTCWGMWLSASGDDKRE